MNTISTGLIPLIASTAWAVGRHAIWAAGTAHEASIAEIQKDLDAFMIALAADAYETEDAITQDLALITFALNAHVKNAKPEALLAA